MSFLDRLKSFFSSDKTTTAAKPDRKKSTKPKSNGKGSLEGTMRYFNRSRGYGFIHKADSKDKVFVHISDLEDRIKVGDDVRFEVEKTEKGPRARKVILAKNR